MKKYSQTSAGGLMGIVAMMVFVPILFGQAPNPPRRPESPPEAVSRLRQEKDSPALSYREATGEEVPILDDYGKFVYQRPEDKTSGQMDEADFYKTLTPFESAVLTPKPQTAPEWIAAAVKIARSGRPEFAKILVAQGKNADGTPAEFAAMLDQIGPSALIDFTHNRVVGDDAVSAAERVMTEAKKHWEDPATLDEAFRHAFMGSEAERIAAVLALRKGGTVGFDRLLEKLLGDDSQGTQRAKILFASLGEFGASGLVATLSTTDARSLERIAAALESFDSIDVDAVLCRYYDETLPASTREALGRVVLQRLGTIPSRSDAAARRCQSGLGYFNKTSPLKLSVEGQTPLWAWDEAKQKAEWITLKDSDAYRFEAARHLVEALGVEALGVARTDATFFPAAVAVAEKTFYDNRLSPARDAEPFTRIFPNLSVAELETILAYAIRSGHPKGGILPAFLLGQAGERSAVIGSGKPTVLVQAATHPDRLLRFSAAQAIVVIKPTESFAGSGRLVESLLAMTTSNGQRKILIAMPKVDSAMEAAHYFSNGTYRFVTARNGAELIRLAAEDADIEFVVTVPYLLHPDPRTCAQTLAADYRTAEIPILLAVEDDTRGSQAVSYAQGEPNIAALPMPVDAEGAQWVLQRFFEMVPTEPVPASERLAQARAAVEMLTVLFGGDKKMIELEDADVVVARILRTPALMESGMTLAQNFRSPAIQAVLGDLVGDIRFDTATRRQQALAAFTDHLKKYGCLLRGPDINRLYDRYNASETESTDSQKILSEMLDAIEAARKTDSAK